MVALVSLARKVLSQPASLQGQRASRANESLAKYLWAKGREYTEAISGAEHAVSTSARRPSSSLDMQSERSPSAAVVTAALVLQAVREMAACAPPEQDTPLLQKVRECLCGLAQRALVKLPEADAAQEVAAKRSLSDVAGVRAQHESLLAEFERVSARCNDLAMAEVSAQAEAGVGAQDCERSLAEREARVLLGKQEADAACRQRVDRREDLGDQMNILEPGHVLAGVHQLASWRGLRRQPGTLASRLFAV